MQSEEHLVETVRGRVRRGRRALRHPAPHSPDGRAALLQTTVRDGKAGEREGDGARAAVDGVRLPSQLLGLFFAFFAGALFFAACCCFPLKVKSASRRGYRVVAASGETPLSGSALIALAAARPLSRAHRAFRRKQRRRRRLPNPLLQQDGQRLSKSALSPNWPRACAAGMRTCGDASERLLQTTHAAVTASLPRISTPSAAQ